MPMFRCSRYSTTVEMAQQAKHIARRRPSVCSLTPTPGPAPWEGSWTPWVGSRSALSSTQQYLVRGQRSSTCSECLLKFSVSRVQKSARAAAAGGVRGPHLAAAQADVAQRAGGRRLREHGVPAELAPM